MSSRRNNNILSEHVKDLQSMTVELKQNFKWKLATFLKHFKRNYIIYGLATLKFMVYLWFI